MGEISLQELVGTILAIVVPVLFWCWRVSANQKHVMDSIETLTEMHCDEDSTFSTKETNRLLRRHIAQEESALKTLNATLRELTHYIRWQTTQTTGKKPPPFIDDPS